MVLIGPKRHKLNCAIKFRFKATNNIAEYEVLLASLRRAKEMQVRKLLINSDSELIIVSQVNCNFTAQDKSMVV